MQQKKTILEAVKELEKKSAFLFDMDGLIFDTERLFMEQLAIVMEEYGYQLTREIYSQTLGTGGAHLVNIMKSFYGDAYPVQEISRIAAKRSRIVAMTVGLCVKPHIRETLTYLQGIGKTCVVASSTHSDTVALYLQKAGLDSFFRAIVGGEQVTKTKPEPEIFLLAAKEAFARPEQCVALEDSENGVRAAFSAGCHVICVPDLKQPKEEVLRMVDILVG